MEYYGGVEQWLAKKTKMKKIEEVSPIKKVPIHFKWPATIFALTIKKTEMMVKDSLNYENVVKLYCKY